MKLVTPPQTSEYTLHVEEKDGKGVLVCTVGKTALHYNVNCVDDLYEMLKQHGDWMELGSADEQKPAKKGRWSLGPLGEKPGRWLVWA